MTDQPTKTIWVTREGKRIRVRDMGDQHLLNTVAMLRRNAWQRMLNEAFRISAFASAHEGTVAADAAGDAANEIAAMEHDEYLEISVPTFAAMLAEIERRGLAQPTDPIFPDNGWPDYDWGDAPQ